MLGYERLTEAPQRSDFKASPPTTSGKRRHLSLATEPMSPDFAARPDTYRWYSHSYEEKKLVSVLNAMHMPQWRIATPDFLRTSDDEGDVS
jgi:hypothetical protein